MNCDVIQDLIPLYIDGCCSEESAKIVEEHMKNCESCRAIWESMRRPCGGVVESAVPTKLRKIDSWKASVLQSLLLFVSFAAITFGVALEAGTPSGLLNGYWAANLVIPATGFLLSLANWYFIGVYKSRKVFSNCSFFATLGITVAAYFWAVFHYEVDVRGLFAGRSVGEILEILQSVVLLNGLGIYLTIALCIFSKTLSNQYAKMMGKE